MREKNRWLKYFEIEKDNNPEEFLILDKIKNFIKTYRYQSDQYKLVWIIRIAAWGLIIAFSIFGLICSIKSVAGS